MIGYLFLLALGFSAAYLADFLTTAKFEESKREKNSLSLLPAKFRMDDHVALPELSLLASLVTLLVGFGYSAFSKYPISSSLIDFFYYLLGGAGYAYYFNFYKFGDKCRQAWRWLAGKFNKNYAKLVAKRDAERELNGDKEMKKFIRLERELNRLIGESNLLAPLTDKVKVFVHLDLPRLLKQRRYLIEHLPEASRVFKDVGAGDNHLAITEFIRSGVTIAKLQRKLQEIETALARMQLKLEHYKVDIVGVNSGLSTEQEVANSSIRDMDSFMDAVRDAVGDVTAADTPPELRPVQTRVRS